MLASDGLSTAGREDVYAALESGAPKPIKIKLGNVYVCHKWS